MELFGFLPVFFFQDKSLPFCQLSFNYVLPKTRINSLFFFFFGLNLLYQQLLTGMVSKPKLSKVLAKSSLQRRGMIISLLVYFIILKVVCTLCSSFPYCFDSYLIQWIKFPTFHFSRIMLWSHTLPACTWHFCCPIKCHLISICIGFLFFAILSTFMSFKN